MRTAVHIRQRAPQSHLATWLCALQVRSMPPGLAEIYSALHSASLCPVLREQSHCAMLGFIRHSTVPRVMRPYPVLRVMRHCAVLRVMHHCTVLGVVCAIMLIIMIIIQTKYKLLYVLMIFSNLCNRQVRISTAFSLLLHVIEEIFVCLKYRFGFIY